MDSAQATELLKKIIAIPSYSGAEEKVADLMQQVIKENGYESHRKGNNVWVYSRHRSEDKPTILLDAHLDTVKATDKWTLDPFCPTVKDGKLYGLGSNDTGGSIVSMLAAFLTLDRKEQSYNLVYSASAEEENTGKHGVQWIVDELGRVDLAIVGEPTGMNAAIAEKGLFVIDCYAKGKAGHAARGEGINAIYEALPDIEWFRNYQFEKVSPLLGPVKMTVTCIGAGTLHNVVPDVCKFTVDIRVNECYNNKEIFDAIRQHVKCDVVPRSFTLNSSSISGTHPVIMRCRELGRTTFASPTTSNQAVLPYPSFKMGPGDSARSHTADEYIKLGEIEEAVEIFVNLLDGMKI